MNKYIIAAVLAALSAIAGQAQRMLPAQKGLELNAGILSSKEATKNYYLGVMFTANRRNGNYWLWGAEYSHRVTDYRSSHIPIETYTGELGYSLQLMGDARKYITLNAGLTAIAGYELINRNTDTLPDGAAILNRDQFIYGGGGRLSLETYLSDRFVLLLHGRTKVLLGTDLRHFRPSAGIGLRFNF